MKKVLVPGLLALLTLGMVSLGSSQDTPQPSCQQTLQHNCTKCHSIKKICTELNKADANWKSIVTTMGERGNLNQDVQDTVFTCLTATPEPKKLVCDK